jgi:hypothetical protein
MTTSEKAPSLARNWISMVGALIALVALANIAFLVFADVGTDHANPYVGILAYVIVPGVMVFGLAVFIVGMLLERRRRRRSAPGDIPTYPRIDLNDPRTRRTFFISIIGMTLFLGISMIGSYQAYHYTDSDAFCGTMCHQIMQPEYTAYQASPHARVGCVGCHIGSGATWYVKSKMSGAYQVYATLAKKYPKPIPTPVENLRPAQETCEQCHWPEKFWGAQLKVFNHFGYDEASTPRETQMLINTGGGSPSSGLAAGIHWHMNIANEVTYIAADRQRQKIPWVRFRNRTTGRVTEYFLQDEQLTPQQIEAADKRVMDCVDCHNRPTHIYVPPDRAVDRLLLAGTMDRSLPYIKQQAVEAMTKDYTSTPGAMTGIAKHLNDYYGSTYPDVYQAKRKNIDATIGAVQSLFQQTIFPEMKTDWRTHPDNIGHFYFPGCFRCHTDQHVSADGKVITKDCDVCHTVVSQKEGGTIMAQAPKNDFVHPVDVGDLRDLACADCHNGGPQ